MKKIALICLLTLVGCKSYHLILIEPHGQECEYDFYSNKKGEHRLVTDTCGMYSLGEKIR